MLKNESARNATKPVPLRPSRLPDSGGIFTSSNGVRMEKISRSVQKVKQAKNLMLTGQGRTVTWHVRTADAGQPDCDTWQMGMKTRGSIRERHVAGPYGGHVASPGRDTCQAEMAFGRTVRPIRR
jgi:hypothetical protein